MQSIKTLQECLSLCPNPLPRSPLASFKNSTNYNIDDYIEPRGDWRTPNQMFARNFKPEYCPIAAIAAIADQSVIESLAVSTFDGQWEIRADSGVTIRSMHWKISHLLDEGNPNRDRFINGIFVHAFPGPNDCHRQHAPFGSVVIEARVIPGQVYLEMIPNEINIGLTLHRTFNAPDSAGYQLVIEARSNLSPTAQVGTHYKRKNRIGMDYPEA